MASGRLYLCLASIVDLFMPREDRQAFLLLLANLVPERPHLFPARVGHAVHLASDHACHPLCPVLLALCITIGILARYIDDRVSMVNVDVFGIALGLQVVQSAGSCGFEPDRRLAMLCSPQNAKDQLRVARYVLQYIAVRQRYADTCQECTYPLRTMSIFQVGHF